MFLGDGESLGDLEVDLNEPRTDECASRNGSHIAERRILKQARKRARLQARIQVRAGLDALPVGSELSASRKSRSHAVDRTEHAERLAVLHLNYARHRKSAHESVHKPALSLEREFVDEIQHEAI